MTRVEGENSRLRHYLARLHRKTFCYSKSEEMLRYSIRLVVHYHQYGSQWLQICVINFVRLLTLCPSNQECEIKLSHNLAMANLLYQLIDVIIIFIPMF